MEERQGERPWGTMLDAGTGANSLRWVNSLDTERWVAVTGSQGEAEIARQALAEADQLRGQIVVGNWAQNDFLQGELYDTVLADYLLGAIEGFAPYFQPYLFRRLRPMVRGRLYVTGLEPYIPQIQPQSVDAQLIWQIGRFRDACVLLKGGMPYREYPAPWAADQIRGAGFAVLSTKHFKTSYKDTFVNAQINIALRGLDRIGDEALAAALTEHGEALRQNALDVIQKEGALGSCRNYIIVAEPIWYGQFKDFRSANRPRRWGYLAGF